MSGIFRHPSDGIGGIIHDRLERLKIMNCGIPSMMPFLDRTEVFQRGRDFVNSPAGRDGEVKVDAGCRIPKNLLRASFPVVSVALPLAFFRCAGMIQSPPILGNRGTWRHC